VLAAEFGATAIRGLALQFFLDDEQAVVLRNAIGTAQRTRLDLPCRRADREIGNRRVFGFTAV
jgi:hypothetical protein